MFYIGGYKNDYYGYYIDSWYFYSAEELIFFIDKLIEYIKSKGVLSFALSKPIL